MRPPEPQPSYTVAFAAALIDPERDTPVIVAGPAESDDYAQTNEPACGKSVRFVSKQRLHHKPIPGSLKGGMKDQSVQKAEDP